MQTVPTSAREYTMTAPPLGVLETISGEMCLYCSLHSITGSMACCWPFDNMTSIVCCVGPIVKQHVAFAVQHRLSFLSLLDNLQVWLNVLHTHGLLAHGVPVIPPVELGRKAGMWLQECGLLSV